MVFHVIEIKKGKRDKLITQKNILDTNSIHILLLLKIANKHALLI